MMAIPCVGYGANRRRMNIPSDKELVSLNEAVPKRPDRPVQVEKVSDREGVGMSDYGAFLESKTRVIPNSGIEMADRDIHPSLFPFQRDRSLAGAVEPE